MRRVSSQQGAAVGQIFRCAPNLPQSAALFVAVNMGPEIYKVERIGSGFLAIMAKPVAGERIDGEFSGIAEKDIKQVVSLLEPHENYDLG